MKALIILLLLPCSLMFSREDYSYSKFCEEYKVNYETSITYKEFLYEVMASAREEFPDVLDVEKRKKRLDASIESLKEYCFMLYLKRFVKEKE